jgi:hypothetical protein
VLGLGLGLVLAVATAPARAQVVGSSDAAALRVLDEQLAAYNASDERAFLATLHFPHVRLNGGQVQVFPTKESYLPELSLRQHGWDYAKWTERRVVHSTVGKVHVVARFARYRADGRQVDSFEAVYIIALRGGRWGVVARSS